MNNFTIQNLYKYNYKLLFVALAGETNQHETH